MTGPANLLPGDAPLAVDISGGDGVPALVEIVYADGERCLLRAIRQLSARDKRVIYALGYAR